MHFAFPRKSSSPSPHARASARAAANLRRQRIQFLSYGVLFILTVYLVYSWMFSVTTRHDDGTVPNNPSVLVVTVLNEESMSEDYIAMIKGNREDYAARHGYKTYFTNASTYKSLYESSPSSWATVPALRHALTLHPEIDYIWSLTPHALITNSTLDLYNHIIRPLPDLMRKDIPVVPPDSVIHTFSHLTSSTTNLILTQDLDNLVHTSFLLRNTFEIPKPAHMPKDTWTQYFLDAWFDPLYRAYAFQKAENHALEHIVQWHPTILAKLVIVQQRRLNSYNFQYPKKEHISTDSMWREGDLVVNFKGCEESDQRDCEKEMRGYFERWKRDVETLDGKPVDIELRVKSEEYVPKKQLKDEGLSEYEKKRIHI